MGGMMSSSLTTDDIAESLGITTRALRKFLRSPQSPYEPVGQGARYNIDADDLVELKEKYGAWVNRSGSRSNSATKAKSTAPRKTRKAPEKVDPLESDGDLMFRLTHTVAERQRLAGVICSYEWHHPKVKGLDVKCTHKPVKGTKYCPAHAQVVYCGDRENPVDDVCGPGGRLPKPYCEWHNGDISEEDVETYFSEKAAGDDK